MPVIQVELSVAGLEAAIAELKEYQRKVEGLGEKVAKRLASDGAENARELASFMNAVDTGELVGSIVGEASGEEGSIKATAGHAAYVEFGTGVVGARSPHPGGSWVYDINAHGDEGWNYIGDDGHLHWTKGMPSRPYMWDTAQMMAEAVPDIVAEELQS